MFTGIIEEMGVVKTIDRNLQSIRLTLLAKTILDDLEIGDSVTVNGVCTTATALIESGFTVDLSPETARVTTLGGLKAGDPVNLERAMRIMDRIGGHLVSGHVEGVGVIRDRKQEENAIILTIEAPADILKYCIKKGSIAVDGVSLTINSLTDRSVTLSIIPHTAKVTTLGLKEIGAPVNLESDLIGKYVERLLGAGGRGPGVRQ
ncbi:MAG: riboflavin synthase [Candidatus Manganitrophus sp.]|nr:riboflavin synthase [Candidatus Manganitrophus sp.]WDT71479.1 MAG: riboflavin synthase [Candidatus Manganitrophus sp.]WDT81183.1 MAG: riboflavin synthase [Candidatus Manganitrophus sp.]